MERVLLPTSEFSPKRGGIARMIEMMAAHIPGLRPVVVAPDATYFDLLRTFWRYRHQYETLFVHHVLPIGTAALMYRIFTGTRYDVFFHGMDFDCARQTRRKRWLLWVILRVARHVYANSVALSHEITRYCGRSVEVMYPSVSDDLIEAAAVVNPRVGDGTRLLTVSRLVERKGHLNVLEVMRKVPELTYTIVGDGPMKKTLERAIAEFGLTERVTMVQHISDGKLPELYASHDIFVMPTTRTSTDREGFGTVYLEAGLFGLPVVATNQSGVDEAVLHNVTGILIDGSTDGLCTALQTLQCNRALRKRLGDAGRARVLADFVPHRTFAIRHARKERVNLRRPLVSVIIPTYQHADVLGHAIRSVQAQTYTPIEIIVVNDGSTDETKRVCDAFGKAITVIHQANHGGNAARNRGLAEAKGEYVLFVDADVVMKPEMIDLFYAALCEHPEASYAYSGFHFGWKRFRGVPFDGTKLRQSNFVMTTSLVRRSDFPGFDPTLRRLQDWDVWLTMLEQGKTGVCVPGIWFSVVIDGESRTGSSWLPAFIYALPWPIFGYTPMRIQKYRHARAVIAEKHHL
jgi:glycosyltransferase involved in cell wall biosynthesis